MSAVITERDIAAVPDVPDDFEFVHGQLVECRPMSYYANLVMNRINKSLILCEPVRSLGESLVEQSFWIPTGNDPQKVRRPDVAFVTFQTCPADREFVLRGNPMPVVPDLAIEVVSPNDAESETRLKRRDYLRAGVKSVWIVYPEDREIYCYSQGTRSPRVFGDGDTLTDPVLPGFELPIDGLFPPIDTGSAQG
jgi:Uma2 family endonuclease